MIMIKTNFQLEKDMFKFQLASPTGNLTTMRQEACVSNSAGKCNRDVRASSARGMCNNIPLRGVPPERAR